MTQYQRTDDRPVIDDPGEWQKLQKLREIARAKQHFLDIRRELAIRGLINDPMADLALRDGLEVYLEELRPRLVEATGDGSIELKHDYWNGVQLGGLSLRTVEPPKGYDSGEITGVRVVSGPQEFCGLRSLWDAPPFIGVEFRRKMRYVGSPPVEETAVREVPVPRNVLSKAYAALESFRLEIGLDLHMAEQRPDSNYSL